MNKSYRKDVRKHALGYYELSEPPSLQELRLYYREQYYQNEKGSYSSSYSEAELNHIHSKIFQKWHFIKDSIVQPGQMIDIGCGEGFTLSFFHELGWSVKGIDFSSSGIELHNRLMLPMFKSGDIFDSIGHECAQGRRYDLVWLQNVLEHVIQPVELLATLRSLVTASGYLVVTVPNDFSDLQSQALESGAIDSHFWVAPPDHLSYFNYESIYKVAEATGWACTGVLADFPIDWLLFNPAANYVRNRAVGKYAHQTRLAVENILSERPVEDVNAMYEALARVGMGRNITAFLTPS